jgi:hypothetical protein
MPVGNAIEIYAARFRQNEQVGVAAEAVTDYVVLQWDFANLPLNDWVSALAPITEISLPLPEHLAIGELILGDGPMEDPLEL